MSIREQNIEVLRDLFKDLKKQGIVASARLNQVWVGGMRHQRAKINAKIDFRGDIYQLMSLQVLVAAILPVKFDSGSGLSFKEQLDKPLIPVKRNLKLLSKLVEVARNTLDADAIKPQLDLIVKNYA